MTEQPLISKAFGQVSERDLEWHFNPRCAVPDFERIVAERRSASMAVMDRWRPIHIERYGKDARSFAVIASHRESDRARPLAVVLHGGYWRSGQPDDNALLIPTLADMGAVPALLGYPLCPTTPLREVVDEVRSGIRHLIKVASRFGAESRRLVLLGISAGAHLAAMAVQDDVISEHVSGICLLSGIYDLTPVPLISVNSEIQLTPEQVFDLSPINHLPRLVTTVLAVGSREPSLWQAQTGAYAALCRARGCDVSIHLCRGRNHFDLIRELEDAPSALSQSARKLVDKPRAN